MNKLIIIPLISFFLLLSGCATNSFVYYAEPAAYFTSLTVLNLSKSEEDKFQKAEVLLSVSSLMKDLTNASPPTPEELEISLNRILPDKLHWEIFSDEIIEIYTNLKDKAIDTEKEQKIVSILNDISYGCYRAAQSYVQY